MWIYFFNNGLKVLSFVFFRELINYQNNHSNNHYLNISMAIFLHIAVAGGILLHNISPFLAHFGALEATSYIHSNMSASNETG